MGIEQSDFPTKTWMDRELLFEPKEFIEAGENVTVLCYFEGSARDTKQKFQSEFVHVFTVRNGKITRWRGFGDTAARYGH